MGAQQTVRDAFGRYLNRTTAHSGACPDCDATLTFAEDRTGLFLATILHDTTCPTFNGTRNS